jgi:hypothetical protein
VVLGFLAILGCQHVLDCLVGHHFRARHLVLGFLVGQLGMGGKVGWALPRR